MADWSQLAYDIIEMIGIRLDAVEDFLAFSAVCRSWRSVYLIKKWTPRLQLPWLMLSDNKNSSVRGFFSLHRDKVYELDLPEATGRRCWGSPDGWLVTIGRDWEIHLLNAYTRVRIILPAPSKFQVLFNTGIDWYQFIDKAIVIRRPSKSTANEEEFLVMAIYGPFKQLAFTKPGYSTWTNVDESYQHRFTDVACINDQIFALPSSGTLLVVDINSQETVEIASPPHEWVCERTFLVESIGDLLMVFQYSVVGFRNHPLAESVKFEVFKFDFSAKEWTELKDLGDRALFVGDNISFSTHATKFLNCRSNSIYFIGSKVEDLWSLDDRFVDRNSGVYNMTDRTVEPFYFCADNPSYYSCPVWLTPV